MNIDQNNLNHQYDYDATLLRIIDGDTVELIVDLGFKVTITEKFRIWGINAPEMNTPDGQMSKDHLASLLRGSMGVHNALAVNTIKDKKDKYGRYLLIIYFGKTTVNELMVNDGYAVEYYP